MGTFSKPDGDLQQFEQDLGSGENHGFVTVELTKKVELKVSAGGIVPLLPLVDKLKASLPAWMQALLTEAEAKYVPQPESAPVGEASASEGASV